MQTKVHVMKQGLVRKNMLECVIVWNCDFEHSNEESNRNSSDEEENQLPMSGRKGDDEILNKKEEKKH